MISIGGLAASMAHEINNPLGVMVQSTQNIIRRLSTDLKQNESAAHRYGTDMNAIRSYIQDRTIDKFLNDILESGVRATSIVNDMLHFSRRSDASKVAVDLAQLLNKTIDLAAHDYDLKKKYDFRKINIIREFEAGLPPVYCAPMEIQQVILNLLSNAAQAMNATAESVAAQIILRLKQEGPMVHIEVEDNGPGMDETTRKRVFEPFFTTKPVGIGTGLGLSVSYFIITNRHKGMLYVNSAPGKGSRFTISLPVPPREETTGVG
jgi:signal transduction histidine kinase